MKQLAPLVLGLLLVGLAQPVMAKSPKRDTGMSWVGVDTGIMLGTVEIDCPATSSDSDCSEGGIFQTLGINFTAADEGAFRLRGVVSLERTDRRPFEVAALVGARMGRNWYALLGPGVIHNVDNDYDGNAIGLAWEILLAPRRPTSAGLDLSFQGNVGPDVQFFNFSIGMRFGDLH